MHRIAEDVWHIPLAPRDAVNAYLVGDVLVDAGYGMSAKRVLRALQGPTVTAHALTHAHPDHAGGSADVVAALGLPGVLVGAADAEAVRHGCAVVAPGAPWIMRRFGARLGAFAPSAVARELREGDVVGPGFTVLEVPGHAPGHIALWRERDRVLLAGDVFFNMHLLTTVAGLRDPPRPLTVDPDRNHESQRRLAALRPAVAGFGHGPIVRDPDALARVAGPGAD